MDPLFTYEYEAIYELNFPMVGVMSVHCSNFGLALVICRLLMA